jgi:5-methylcytosine-specific restriction endonuclease McrA
MIKLSFRFLNSGNPNWKGGKPHCKNCGKQLSRYDAKSCKPCSLQLQKGKNHPNYRDGRTLKSYFCKCGKELKHYLSEKCRECANKEHSQKMKGKGNPNFLNSKIKSAYPYNWNSIKKKIYKRDNYTCQICRKSGYDIHHIDYNKSNCKDKNLICLCRRCHAKTNYNRYYWIKKLLLLINKIYQNG